MTVVLAAVRAEPLAPAGPLCPECGSADVGDHSGYRFCTVPEATPDWEWEAWCNACGWTDGSWWEWQRQLAKLFPPPRPGRPDQPPDLDDPDIPPF